MKFKKLRKQISWECSTKDTQLKISVEGNTHGYSSTDDIPEKFDKYDVEDIDISHNKIYLKKKKKKKSSDEFDSELERIDDVIGGLKSKKTDSYNRPHRTTLHRYKPNDFNAKRNQRQKYSEKTEQTHSKDIPEKDETKKVDQDKEST